MATAKNDVHRNCVLGVCTTLLSFACKRSLPLPPARQTRGKPTVRRAAALLVSQQLLQLCEAPLDEIALAAAKRAGKLSEPKRVKLLQQMTEEVGEIVLEDNRLQALALSIAEAGGSAGLPGFVRTIEMLEGSGRLDRKVEGLAASDALLERPSWRAHGAARRQRGPIH